MQADITHEQIDARSLFQRLNKLERENRKLKRVLLIASLFSLALFTMGQVRPVPKVIQAERFVLKDSSGKEKAWLGMGELGPELKLDDVDAKRATFTSIQAGGIHIYRTGEGKDVTMLMGPGGVFFTIDEKGEEQKTSMYASGPAIELTDKQGFQTTIGATNLETAKTGESHKTSAASIVIFDKEKNVIWRAPLR